MAWRMELRAWGMGSRMLARGRNNSGVKLYNDLRTIDDRIGVIGDVVFSDCIERESVNLKGRAYVCTMEAQRKGNGKRIQTKAAEL